jgi:TolB-like protein/Flp pilus assembly protein TadD
LSSRFRNFSAELKRRRVYRVAVAYAAVAFVIWQAADFVLPAARVPDWTHTLVLVFTLVGFPIALVLAWALEITPEGIRRTPPAGGPEPPRPVPRQRRTDDRPYVVVLPFANLSGDPDNEYFSDGVTEDIMARLAAIRGVRVISRTTAMTYKGSDRNLPQIAEELGVQAVVYDRVLEDVFAVQSDVAENIARALHAELTPGERERLHRKPTENLEAYDLCLKGMRIGESLDPEALRQAERYFQGAIALDPGYARAYAGLSWTLGLKGFLGNVVPAELFPQLKTVAQEAIRLDPDLGEAHTALAAVAFWYEWDWAKAVSETARALELNPDDSWALGYRGWTFLMRERFAEAEAALNEAVRLDPLSPLRRVWLAHLHAFTGSPEEGVSVLDAVLRSDPQVYVARYWRGVCHMHAGNLSEAASDFDEATASVGRLPVPVALRGVVHAFAGETESARQILEELRSRATEEYVDPYFLFALCLAIEGFDAAFPYLGQMLETRSVFVSYLRVVPRYKEFRSDPRFLDALRTIWPDDAF